MNPETLLDSPAETPSVAPRSAEPVQKVRTNIFGDPVEEPADHRPANPFDYKPMPVIAPVALFLGVVSMLAWFGFAGVVVALVGLIVSLFAIYTVHRGEGTLSGMLVAQSAAILCTVCLVGGAALNVYLYMHEVPEGFRRLSFSADISKKKLIQEDGVWKIHPDVEALRDQPVFIKGYMYPTKKAEGLSAFILVKDNGDCCFGGQPAITDMILVRMQDDIKVDFRQSMVSIAGTFRPVDFSKVDALPADVDASQGPSHPIYELEATFYTPSVTAY